MTLRLMCSIFISNIAEKDKDKKKDILYIYDAANNELYDSIHRVKKYSLPKKK